ncbi:MAG: hypothetical protein WCT01_01740 [Candidatus Shapirobacteria bacterium]
MLDLEMWILVIIGLIFRVILAPSVFHQDLLSQAGWGEYIRINGPKSFYENNVWLFSWPNHPPLVSLEYGVGHWIFEKLGFVIPRVGMAGYNYLGNIEVGKRIANNYVSLVSPEMPFSWGYLFSLKMMPIMGDILVGLVIYLVAKRFTKRPLTYLALYLFLPISWYVSTLWGQTDPLAFLFTIVSVLIIRKYPILSVLSLWMSISLKPTSLLIGPLYLIYWYRLGLDYKKLVIGGTMALLFTIAYVIPFSNENPVWYFLNTILRKVFWRAEFRLTTNAYNFWHMFWLNRNMSQDVLIGLLPAKWWGLIIYGGLNLGVWLRLKKMDLKQRIEALFIVAAGGWFFLTNMLDRYLFTGLVAGMLVTMWRPKLMGVWFIMGTIYWINLFRGWWYPNQLDWLKQLLTNNDYLAGRPISIINTAIFLIMAFEILKNYEPRTAKRDSEERVLIKTG